MRLFSKEELITAWQYGKTIKVEGANYGVNVQAPANKFYLTKNTYSQNENSGFNGTEIWLEKVNQDTFKAITPNT
jgi:hypothetical protein